MLYRQENSIRLWMSLSRKPLQILKCKARLPNPYTCQKEQSLRGQRSPEPSGETPRAQRGNTNHSKFRFPKWNRARFRNRSGARAARRGRRGPGAGRPRGGWQRRRSAGAAGAAGSRWERTGREGAAAARSQPRAAPLLAVPGPAAPPPVPSRASLSGATSRRDGSPEMARRTHPPGPAPLLRSFVGQRGA